MRAAYACLLMTFSATSCMTPAQEDPLPPPLAGIAFGSPSFAGDSGDLSPNACVEEKRGDAMAHTVEPMARQ
jgi:hypothetical protein